LRSQSFGHSPLLHEDRTRLLRPFALLLCAALASLSCSTTHVADGAERAIHPASAEPTFLVIRADDAAMSHSVNVALEQLIASGLPVSVSVMPPCPWFQETVALLKRYPAVSVGIHLTLNSEWKNLRWGPVAGRGSVPSLVDEDGYFFPSGELLARNRPEPLHVELELRAQIQRALRSGLHVDYVDYHMGTALRFPEFREITERLAQEFGLGMSGYFGETMDSPQYAAAPAHKIDSLLVLIDRLRPGVNVVVTHVGIDDAELGALIDMNTEYPLPDMSKHRQAELTALTSRRFAAALKSRNVQLLTYRQLIEHKGLHAMRRPGG
jgi:chitin disaccharide deacetylase